MILKLRVPEYVGSVIRSGGWKYVDGIERVDVHGPVMADDGSGPRVFGSYDELKQWVNDCWGAPERSFDFELWPEWPRSEGFARYLTCAVLRLKDGGVVLAMLTEDCYLLGENGQTVDRLCTSGKAFV